MRTLPLLLLLALASSPAPVFGQAKGRPADPFPPPPDHLVPIAPDDREVHAIYYDKLNRLLQVPSEPEAAVMVYRPSFEPEECLVIHKNREGTTYNVIHTRADKLIWNLQFFKEVDGKKIPVKVTRRERGLPRGLAERVCRVWDRMLRGLRYPANDDGGVGMDGEIIEFRSNRMYGETWSPDETTPRLKRFLDLARSLIEFCDAPEADRPARLKAVEASCEVLEKDLDNKKKAN